MKRTQITEYGSWRSPVSSDLIVSESIKLSEIIFEGDDLYWIETRPLEKGRNVIVKYSSSGKIVDVTPAEFNARTRVHEYGGGSYIVDEGTIYFTNFSDQQIYRQLPDEKPELITNNEHIYYADFAMDKFHGRLISVAEDHACKQAKVKNFISIIDLKNDCKDKILHGDNDFYSNPSISPNGAYLSWLSWNHPNMPWDRTELWVGRLDKNGITQCEQIAGGINESIFEPIWSPQGSLYFVSDRSGWWNIYKWENRSINPVLPMKAEFGLPQWVFGLSTYAFVNDNCIVCTYAQNGTWKLANIYLDSGKYKIIESPFTDFKYISATKNKTAFIAGSPDMPYALILLSNSNAEYKVLRSSCNISLDEDYLSFAQAIEFPTKDKKTAHAFFYKPKNKKYVGPQGKRPPLLVISHGGPTTAASNVLNLFIQYWTSRGIAVVDVNYGGSTGYGREYRQRLDGKWGIVDVEDCVNAAAYLVQTQQVDKNALAIRGGSAGGFTTLCALVFTNFFKVGASYYGVSDLESLVKKTHKFESHYLFRLVGKYPEEINVYKKRSPINFVDNLSCPVIFFQGLEDKIVPPDQAKIIVDALGKKDLEVAYIEFADEQHGFRRAENIKRALDAELYFYSHVFGFSLPWNEGMVDIQNI